MFIRPPRLAPARQAAASLGWLAESVAATASERSPPRHLGLVRPEPRRSATEVELLSAEAAASQIGPWRDLVSRSLEPNIFLDPDFALPAAQHVIAARRPALLFVRSAGRGGEAPELIGLAALHLPRGTHRVRSGENLVSAASRVGLALARPDTRRRGPGSHARVARPTAGEGAAVAACSHGGPDDGAHASAHRDGHIALRAF